MEETLQSQARHLSEVEKLSIRQTAQKLGISRKKASRLIGVDNLKRKVPDSIIKPYERLIQQWYKEYPFLQAIQVFKRLKEYGYKGGYTAVREYTLPLRKKKKKQSYHELEFLPGEEAQVDLSADRQAGCRGQCHLGLSTDSSSYLHIHGICMRDSTPDTQWSSSLTVT